MSQAVFYGVFVYFWMKIRFFCSCCTISPQNVCSSCWQIIWLTSSCIHRIRSLVELCYYDAVQVPVLWPWELCVGTGKERPENPLSGKLRRQVSDQGRTDFSVSDTNLPGSLSSAGNSLTWPLLTNLADDCMQDITQLCLLGLPMYSLTIEKHTEKLFITCTFRLAHL